MEEPKLPGVDSTVETYLDAWSVFQNDEFKVEELWSRLMSQSSDVDEVPEQSTLDSRLYRAAAFGLADWYGEGKYELCLNPEADDEQWNSQAKEHMKEVKEKLQMEHQNKKKNEDEENDGLVTVDHEGETYVRSDVGPNTDLQGQARFYNAVLNQTEGHNGIVLRCFPQVWKQVEQLSERITDDEKMDDAECMYRFEKVESDLVPNEGDQEYHIYLRETRFLN